MFAEGYPGVGPFTASFPKGSRDGALDPRITQTRFVAYAIIGPIMIITGMVGNILTILLLRQPQFRGVTYTYFLALAVSDLLSLFFSISLMVHLVRVGTRVYSTAVWYSYFEIFFVNAPMSASVLIVVFVTIDRFFSVCRPREFKNIHTMRHARKCLFGAFAIAVLLWLPTCTLKKPMIYDKCNTTTFSPPDNGTWWLACMMSTLDQSWYVGYSWLRQIVVTFIPTIAMIVMNTLIVKEFVQIRRKRSEMNGGAYGDQQTIESRRKDDKNLINLLRAVTISFFITMVPSGIFNAMYTEVLSTELEYEVFRAVANDLELLNHALNFYLYILCSKPIRAAITVYVEKYRKSLQESHVSRKVRSLTELVRNRIARNSPPPSPSDNVVLRSVAGDKRERWKTMSRETEPSDIGPSPAVSPEREEQIPSTVAPEISGEDATSIRDFDKKREHSHQNGRVAESLPRRQSHFQTVVHTVEIHSQTNDQVSLSESQVKLSSGEVNFGFEDTDKVLTENTEKSSSEDSSDDHDGEKNSEVSVGNGNPMIIKTSSEAWV